MNPKMNKSSNPLDGSNQICWRGNIELKGGILKDLDPLDLDSIKIILVKANLHYSFPPLVKASGNLY